MVFHKLVRGVHIDAVRGEILRMGYDLRGVLIYLGFDGRI